MTKRGYASPDGRRDVVLLAACLAGLFAAGAAFADEGALIAVLKSDAPIEQKSAACRQLAIVGTKQAVPALAALLVDEKLSHMARYALEPIPDPAVDSALREAVGKVTGVLRTGVINSIGVRRDGKATSVLIPLLPDPAAAMALARIGASSAVDALEKGLPANPDACLLAAEKKPELYDRLLAGNTPAPVRVAALRGAIVNGRSAADRISGALRSGDYATAATAVGASMELRERKITDVLADAVPGLADDLKILVIQALGARGDGGATGALIQAARTGEARVRLAAVASLAQIGGAVVVPVLAELTSDGNSEVADAARQALGGIAGDEADKAVAAMLSDRIPSVRRMGATLAVQRRTTGAVPALLKMAADSDVETGKAAFKGLGALAGKSDLPALLAILLGTKHIEAAEQAVAAVCARSGASMPAAIVVKSAVYGDLPAGKSKDVTKRVAKLVKDGKLAFGTAEGEFGDPAPGIVKKLTVDYTCNGVDASLTVMEGDTVTLAAPSVSG